VEEERFLLILEKNDSKELKKIFDRIFGENPEMRIFLNRIETIIDLNNSNKTHNNMSAFLAYKDSNKGLLLANKETGESKICLSIFV